MKIEDYTILIDNKKECFNIDKFYIDNPNGLSKIYTAGNGNLIKEAAGEDGSWYASYSRRPDSCFSVYREYNLRGIIRKKWAVFRNGGAIVGTSYEFYDDGTLKNKRDVEKNFDFTPNHVIQFCIKHNIDLVKNSYNSIEREEDATTGKFLYVINYLGEYNSKYGEIERVLNGKNGEEEQITIYPAGNNEPEVLFKKDSI